MVIQISKGTFTGTGNDVSVTVGFKPSSVKVINKSDGVVTETIDGLAPKAINTVTGETVAITVVDDKIEITDSGFVFKGSTSDKEYVYLVFG